MTQLPQQSFLIPWPCLSVFGTSQTMSLRDKCHRWHCSRHLAPFISTDSALPHRLWPWWLGPIRCWPFPEEALVQEKGTGNFPHKANEKDKKSTGTEEEEHLKFRLPRMSFSIIANGLILVLEEHLPPCAGCLKNMQFSGEGSQLQVPSVEILFGN